MLGGDSDVPAICMRQLLTTSGEALPRTAETPALALPVRAFDQATINAAIKEPSSYSLDAPNLAAIFQSWRDWQVDMKRGSPRRYG